MEQEQIKALNKIDIEGELLDQKLEYHKDAKGQVDAIKGTITVQVSEDNKPKVNIYQGKFTKAKEGEQPKVKKSFETLEKIMKGEVKSIANATDEEPAAIVSIWSGEDSFTPNLEENINPKTGVSTVRNSLGFGNITIRDNYTKKGARAEFEIECVVNSIKEEKDENGEWTGRAIVDVSIPDTRKGLTNLTLILPEIGEDDEGEFQLAEELLDTADDIIDANGIYFYGDIYNLAIEKEEGRKSTGRGRGRRKVETKTTYESSLVVKCFDYLTQNEGEKFWEDDVVAKLRNEREAYIENEKQKAEERENNSQTSDRRESTGNVGGARATGGRSRSRNRGF